MTARSEKRRVRRELSANVSEYLVGNEDGAAMLAHAVVWLGQLAGFERTTPALREAIVVDVLGRELCQFEAFIDDFGLPGIRLVDVNGHPLSLAVLTAARLRAKLKGIFGYDR